MRNAEPPQHRHWTLSPWLPLGLALVFVLLGFGLWQSLSSHEQQQTRMELDSEAERISRDFERALNDYIQVVERKAARAAREGELDESGWRADARDLIEHYPHFQALQYTDSDRTIRWIEPLAGNESALGLNIALNPQRAAALSYAAATGITDLSGIIDLQQGGSGVVAYAPIGTGEQLQGFINGVFRLSDLTGGLLRPLARDHFDVLITESDDPGVRFEVPGPEGELADVAAQSRLAIRNLRWTLTLTPTRDWVSDRQSNWSVWLFATLAGAGILLAALLFLGQRVWRRSWQLAYTRERLRLEMDQRLHAQADLDRVASVDPLTGLANRRFFVDNLSHRLQRQDEQEQLALIAVDLDGFHPLNDSLGHELGDQILKETARRLGELEDETTLACRSSGDEFFLSRHSVRSLDSVFRLLERIRDCFRPPFELDGDSLTMSASIGVALYPDNGDSAEILLRNADAAMHQAKALNATQYQFYNEGIHEHAARQLQLQRDLQRAVNNREFVLHYQPQQDLATGQVGMLEARVRWQHPEHGLLSPGEFLPAAHESGLITDIGRQVIAMACEQLHEWRHGDFAHLSIAVNLSGPELRQPDLVEYLAACLRRYDLPPARIELELSEEHLIREPELYTPQLEALTRLGIGIAIDGFGGGYSSLSWLRDFPIQMLKIDPGFIRQVTRSHNDGVIVKAIINLAHNLGIQVTAVGVETESQLAFLRAHRCDFAQGNLLGPPRPKESLESVLALIRPI